MSTSAHRHFHGLDLLRACAILMVIPRHARELMGKSFWGPDLTRLFNHGWIGVELFFVLSGFLISTQLFQSVSQQGRVPFKTFYLKRSFRILPSYLTVLFIYIVWPEFREKPDLDPAWHFIFFTMNYGRVGEAFSHAWSLCVEEHFYLVFPSIVGLYLWRPKVFRPWILVFGVLLFELLVRWYLKEQNAPFFESVYRRSHTHLDGLTIGVSLALIRTFRPQIWSKLTAHPYILFLLGTVAVTYGALLYETLGETTSYVMTFFAIAIGFGAIMVAALSPLFWFAQKKLPGVSSVATLAFTLYLIHKQMIHLAMTNISDYQNSPATTIFVAVTLMTVASLLLHYSVERPFLRIRDRLLA